MSALMSEELARDPVWV